MDEEPKIELETTDEAPAPPAESAPAPAPVVETAAPVAPPETEAPPAPETPAEPAAPEAPAEPASPETPAKSGGGKGMIVAVVAVVVVVVLIAFIFMGPSAHELEGTWNLQTMKTEMPNPLNTTQIIVSWNNTTVSGEVIVFESDGTGTGPMGTFTWEEVDSNTISLTEAGGTALNFDYTISGETMTSSMDITEMGMTITVTYTATKA